jgi:hypothetical protein
MSPSYQVGLWKQESFLVPHQFCVRTLAGSARGLWNYAPLRRKVLVVNQTVRSELFPAHFPPELTSAAFVAGNEAAWPPMLAAAAVEWLGAWGYAVLGTELWVLKGGAIQSLPIGQSGMREVHGNTVNRETGEPWSSFVARAATETLTYLQSFNPADIVEQGELHFNVVWVSEAQFAELTPS